MAKKPKNQNTEINNAANDLTEALNEQTEEQVPVEQVNESNDLTSTNDEVENVNTPEPNSSAEGLHAQITTQPPIVPVKIKMLKNFRIEMPLAGRKDVFFTLSLKKDQEITDERIINHVIKSDVPFEIQ
jgi:hypothetical protein